MNPLFLWIIVTFGDSCLDLLQILGAAGQIIPFQKYLITCYGNGCNRFFSLNTRGFRRWELFHYLHLKQFPVVLLQETHSTYAQEAIWRSQWGKSIWFSHGTSKSTGVAILIGGNFYYEVHDVISDEEGSFLIMDVTLGEQRITLVNLYGPNKDDTIFFYKFDGSGWKLTKRQ